jgi:hypothetical protein
METIEPKRKLLLTFKEFCDRIPPEETNAWYDRLKKAEADLPAIQLRLDALVDSMDDGWCPPRVVQGELSHLNDVMSKFHLRKYTAETLQTLVDAEADLARWQTLSEAERDAIWAADEAAEAELVARRAVEQQLRKRSEAFYAACKQANAFPPPRRPEDTEPPLDNEIANWSIDA